MTASDTLQRTDSRRSLARVVFTGKLASMTRRAATEALRAWGGEVVSTVSRRTTMVVVGMDGWPLLADGLLTRSLRRAEELNESGAGIRVTSETEFLEMIGLRERSFDAGKSYSADQVGEIVGLEASTLNRWEALGLVRSSDGWYDFRDLVSLRTIVDLIGRGVDPRTIARSVQRLDRIVPGTDRPLAQLKIVARSGDLLAEIEGALLAPDGQLMMDFEGDGEAASCDTTPIRVDEHAGRTAEEWFEAALADEESGRNDGAVNGYRRALAIQPHFPEAHFNLGNVLREQEQLDAAREQMLMAVSEDPGMSVAWYNLADIQEELGDLEGAVASLRSAVTVAPDFADAHFNLALCFETLDDIESSCRHWQAYLRLDPVGEWADAAREKLHSRHYGKQG